MLRTMAEAENRIPTSEDPRTITSMEFYSFIDYHRQAILCNGRRARVCFSRCFSCAQFPTPLGKRSNCAKRRKYNAHNKYFSINFAASSSFSFPLSPVVIVVGVALALCAIALDAALRAPFPSAIIEEGCYSGFGKKLIDFAMVLICLAVGFYQ